MFFTSWVFACFYFAACVQSLGMALKPKERNVTQGQTHKFRYQPATNISTNVTVLDTLKNMTIHVVDDATEGRFNWSVPENLEVRGGYFFQLKQYVNNATIVASSDSEFQVLEKPKPKPSSTSGNTSDTTSHLAGTRELASSAGMAALGVFLLQNL